MPRRFFGFVYKNPPTLPPYSLACSPSFRLTSLPHLPLPSRAVCECVIIPQPTFALPPPPISHSVSALRSIATVTWTLIAYLPLIDLPDLPFGPSRIAFYTSIDLSLRSSPPSSSASPPPCPSLHLRPLSPTPISSSGVESVRHLLLEQSERFGMTSTVQ